MSAAVLAVGAIALAGCGGSSSGGSSSSSSSNSGASTGTGAGAGLNQDVQTVNKAVQSYKAGTHGVATNGNDPASWDQLSQAAKQAADSIKGLTPPASLQSSQQALVSSLSDVSDKASKVATDLRNKDASALQADLAQAKAASDSYVTAGAAFAQAARAAGGG
ncbi:hypothetical protein AYO39_03200 [Actinobacteria bacterium SCGC AG-212-D09]|nr:hypothetical protein AYO39_03200 [Actinobacteria bacterium SCGC AG-212-D09]